MFASFSLRRMPRTVAAVALATVSTHAMAIFQNGGFEQNSYANWTVGGGTNPGLSGSAPFTGASIVINGNTPGPASIIGAGTDPRAPQLVLPRLDQRSAKLNDEAGGSLVTTLKQTGTLTSADVDPADSQPHIRFSFAPVLQDPGHSAQDQPYFYVALKNLTTNTVVYEKFAYSAQVGVNFLADGLTGWKYLPFENVDVAFPPSAVGQQIELTVIAADCSLGAHGGYVYLDGFGSAALPPNGGSTQGPAVPAPALDGKSLGLLALLLGIAGWVVARLR